MDLLTVATFLGILVILAAAFDVVLLGAFALRRSSATAEAATAMVGEWGLWLAFLVAGTAMAGSLYFSEVAHLTPCVLCWYQRIAMYPLAIILLVAALRSDVWVRPYVLLLSGIGGVISAYHILVERLPGLPTGSCSLEAPCSVPVLEIFGFMSVPVMAFVGFVTIFLITLLSAPATDEVAA